MSKARDFAELLSSTGIFADGEVSASEVTNLHTVATSGSYNDLGDTPNLHTVATSGSYTDLANVPSTFTPSSHTLDSHSNVTITSASTDQFLKWNGSAWVNDDIPQINSVGDISNVTITSAATGDFLRYNGTAWVDSTIQDSDISSSAVTQHLGSYATTSYVDTEVANLVDSAPGTLDTLNELAAALGDDANFSTTVTNSIATKLNSSSYTAADVLTKIKTVDGASSGLDADLLDGQQGSYYLDWGNVTNKPDPTLTLNGDVSGSATFTDVGNATLTVTIADDSHNHTIANVDGLQTALDAKLASSSYTASDVLTKIKTVDGSGSGLDADTVDGLQSSQFLRSDAADTLTADLTVDKASAKIKMGFNGGPHGIDFYDDDGSTLTWGFYYRTSPDTITFETGGNSTKWSLDTSGNVTQSGDLTVNGGDITLGGTGRIQGIDTVSAGTDAANKNYVDNAIATQSSGTSYATIVAFG